MGGLFLKGGNMGYDERVLFNIGYTLSQIKRHGIMYKNGKPGVMVDDYCSSDSSMSIPKTWKPLTELDMIYKELDDEFPGMRDSKNDIVRGE
jgi:hypothetical protein